MILPSTCDTIIALADRAIGADQVGSLDDFYNREKALQTYLDCVQFKEMAQLAKAALRLRARPIERDEAYARDYIILPHGWEVQTKGRGSSFRLCRVEGAEHERWIVTDERLHPVLERMAREIHAELVAPPVT